MNEYTKDSEAGDGGGRPSASRQDHPSSISEIRWKGRMGEKQENIPFALSVQDPYDSFDENARKAKLKSEAKAALADSYSEPHKIIQTIPGVDTFDGIGVRGKWDILPEEINTLGVLLNLDRAKRDEYTGVDSTSMGFVLYFVNSDSEGKTQYDPAGLVGRMKWGSEHRRRDVIGPLQNKIAKYVEEKGQTHRGYDHRDVFTYRGLDACICIALACGQVETALSLIEGASTLLIEDSATALALSRNADNFRKAYEMYPVNLKQYYDAVMASIGPDLFPTLAQGAETAKKDSLTRIRAQAISQRDRWYTAQQACGTPEALRRRYKPEEYVTNIVESGKTGIKDVEGHIAQTASEVTDAQIAENIARELARRVHPERTIEAHVQTQITRSLRDPKHTGPSFDPIEGALNEYVALYGAHPASKLPADRASTLRIPGNQEKDYYSSNPDRVDVAAFLRFLNDPPGFIRAIGNSVPEGVAKVMVERFVPGMQFLSALVYSEKKGYLNERIQTLIRTQLGIKVEAVQISNAVAALKSIAPTHELMALNSTSLTVDRNLSLQNDQQTLREILDKVPEAKETEISFAREATVQALREKLRVLTETKNSAQNILDAVPLAEEALRKIESEITRLSSEKTAAETAKVGKGFGGIGKGKYVDRAERDVDIARIAQQIKAKDSQLGQARATLVRAKEAANYNKRQEVERSQKQIDQLQKILEKLV